MRTAVAVIAGLSVVSTLTGGALAQTDERYRLERTEDGYVRMDTQTGVMTLCQERLGELVCRQASEGGEGSGSDLEALNARVAALEERIEALEQGEESGVPLEQEFEQSLNLMERFFRRFVDIVRGLEQEEQGEPQSPGGDTAPAERT